MERAREVKEATGEIESEHPGYLGSQDTYCVGIKGARRIYQQTFVDTYTELAFVKHSDQNAKVAADLLNEQVLPFFEEENIRSLCILVDLDQWLWQYNHDLAHSGIFALTVSRTRRFKRRSTYPKKNAGQTVPEEGK